MRITALILALFFHAGVTAQSRYSYVECTNKYRATYGTAEELDKFCYARIACSGEKGMGRAGCSTALTKNEKLYKCVHTKRTASACTTSTCLEKSIYSCAHRCPEGYARAGNRCSSSAMVAGVPTETTIEFDQPNAGTRSPASTGE